MIRLALVALATALFLAVLLLASHIGEQLRCQRLTDSHSTALTTYCNGDTK